MIGGVEALSLYKLFQFVIKFRTGGSCSLISGGGGIGAILIWKTNGEELFGKYAF